MKDRLPLVADLLMDAAYADNHLAGEEKTAVRKLLRDLLGQEALPMDIDFRIDEFAPQGFDLAGTGRAFAGDSPAQKRRLLELCAAVHAADGELDRAEDAHLRRVAGAIGLADDEYADMVVEVLEDIAVDATDLQAVR